MASDPSTWSALKSLVESGGGDITVNATVTEITAPAGSEAISSPHNVTIFLANQYGEVGDVPVTGGGGANPVFNNTGSLTIMYGSVNSNSTNSLAYAVTNMEFLTLGATSLIGGVGQFVSNASLTIINAGDSIGGDATTTLSGDSNFITAGHVGFGTGTAGGNTLNINGGVLASGAIVNLAAGNTLSVSGGPDAGCTSSGSITLDNADTWAGELCVQGTGTLTLDGVTHTSNGSFVQYGGTTLLTGGSTLTLVAESMITYGNITLDGTSGKTGNTLNIAGGYIGSTGNDTIMDLEAGNTINLTSGYMMLGAGCTLNGSLNVAAPGALTFSGGTFNSPNINYASGAALNLINGVNYNQSSGSFTNQSGVTLNIGSVDSAGGTFMVSGTGVLSKDVNIVINQGNNLEITGGQATLDGSDNWGGTIADPDTQAFTSNADVFVSETGILTLDGVTKNTQNDNYNQTGGTLNLINGSGLTLAAYSPSSVITTNGTGTGTTTVNIGAETGNDTSSLIIGADIILKTAAAGDQLIVNIGTAATTGNSLNVAAGNLDATAQVVLNAGNDLNVTSGTATLNGSGPANTQDAWNGNVNVTGGTLLLNKINSQTGSSFTQAGGTLALENGSASTLSSSATISSTPASHSTVNIGAGSTNGNTLTLNDGLITGAKTTVNVGTVGSSGNTLEISGTGNLDASAIVIVNVGNNLNISGGQATLNSDPNLTVNTSLLGNLNLSAGILNLNNLNINNYFNPSKIYTQTGGTLNIDNTDLTLYNGETITTSGDGVTSTVNIDGGSGLTLKGNSSITTADAGGTANINIGSASNGNTLSVSSVSSMVTNGSSGSTNINIGVGASTGNAFTLSAGNVLGSGTTVNIGTTTTGSSGNSLTVSGSGMLDLSSKVVINTNNALNIWSGGTAILDSADTWAGTINMSGGTLTINAVTSNGHLVQTGGSFTLEVSSILNLGGTSALSGPLLVTGNSIFTHEGSSTMAGKATVNSGGIVGIKNGTELGAPAVFVADQVTLNGGTLMNMTDATSATEFISYWSPTLSSNVGIALGSAGGTFRVGYWGTTLTINGVISGTGGLTKTDISILVLGGANTYTGPTTVTAGTLSVMNPNFCPTAPLTIASGAVLHLPNISVCKVSALVLGGVTQPEGLYQASNTGGTITGQGVIQVGDAVVTSAYLTWAASFPGLSDAYPTHDPDDDGMTNQQEYAFGLDPTSGASVNPIRVQLDKAHGTFSYSRLVPATTGLSYTVQTSSDLSTWSVDAGATQTVTQTVSGVQTVQVTLSGPIPLAALQLFVRVAAQ